ncbi:transmembrane protein 100 [Latimeria chalumnae]|uniref:transmembrane protein 100 n=1 Tax=Latimeria chalumnae TaxID=7897 RepID=UPI0006D8F409|nr:PREDICTED: transmembrane protein 100-like [Latimeria chalumnae]|eukprot:XP_014347245.1 PREDICTED: transmembrane protein 100-like [Latimeria chalumnae]
MTGCKSNTMTCHQAQNPGMPVVKIVDSASTINKLALATGGTEKSWHRCIFPFGIVSLVIGIAVTSITFTFNTPEMEPARISSLVVLVFGVLLIVAAFACWKIQTEKKRKRMENAISKDQGVL